jgi:hypothetical protein
MTGFLAPGFGAGWQALNAQGIVLAGGKLHTYDGGSTSTNRATYTDSALGTPNANPIILGSDGRPPNEIWLDSGSYKFVLCDSNDVPISNGSWDYISGLNNYTISTVEWVVSGLTPTYLSPTSLSVLGNQTAIFTVGRRIQYTLAGGTYYGYVSAVSFDSINTTTVTIVPDATNLDNTLSTVNYSLLNSLNSSVPENTILKIISRSTSKATPVDADMLALYDSAATTIPKKLSWSNLKATLHTYFSSLTETWPLNISGNAASATTADSATVALTLTVSVGASVTGTTQALNNNSTKIATTAYVDRANNANFQGSFFVNQFFPTF